ncbi:hypothetical protein RJ641_004498 [Dillenia turbinata]|uniref:Uncharacterized protein n=1 Tax=Dillenia turbinata TaxID=194707 RepID=A0AAN8Z8A5_9MAGN
MAMGSIISISGGGGKGGSMSGRNRRDAVRQKNNINDIDSDLPNPRERERLLGYTESKDVAGEDFWRVEGRRRSCNTPSCDPGGAWFRVDGTENLSQG